MKLFLKSTVLFLTLFVLFIAAGSVILKANAFDTKNKNNFSGAQFTSSDNDDDEEESDSSRDDDDSESAKDSSDENTDDNSVDEYNYSDDD